MNIRHRHFAVVISIIVTLLTGCSSSSIIEDKNTIKRLTDEAQKRIVIWHTYSDEETLVFEKEIIPRFEAEHPGIIIESVRQNHNQEYHTALLSRASAGKTPDIIRMDYTWVPLFANRGLLYPLDEFTDSDQVAGQLHSRMLKTNEHNGRLYGLPLNITTKAAIFNVKLLNELGMKEPPESFLETVELARNSGYIIGMSGIELWGSLPYFMALGGRLADELFTVTDGYFNSETSIAAMEQLLVLYKEGVINPEMLAGNADLWNEVYSSNRVFMIDEGPWYYSILMNSSSVNVDLPRQTKPIPFQSDGSAASIIGGESLVMTKNARNKPEAWVFIRWMMQSKTQMTLFKTGLIPVNSEAFESARQSVNGANHYLEPYMDGIQRAFYRPSLPEWNEIEKLYDLAMENIFIRGSDIRTTLQETSAKMDAVLEEGKKR